MAHREQGVPAPVDAGRKAPRRMGASLRFPCVDLAEGAMRIASMFPWHGSAIRALIASLFALLPACSSPAADSPDTGSAEARFPNPILDDSARAQSTAVSAPVPMSPPDSATFEYFPRHTVLSWSDVPRARSYIVEVQICSATACNDSVARPLGKARAFGNAYAFDFVGANAGRWRVQAVDSAGAVSPPSAWSHFAHRR
jgi:hypothetical protein